MIYVASSWRNEYQPLVVSGLRMAGFQVFDFRDNDAMFHWREIDERWRFWDFEKCQRAMDHNLAKRAFEVDFGALQKADAVVLVMPCGRSAHLELGWAVGRGLPTAVLHDRLMPVDPELMHNIVGIQTPHLATVISFLKQSTDEKEQCR